MHDYWLEFSKVALAHLLAVASPGPDFAIVLKQSLSCGRRAAIWTSIGVGTAIVLHVTYSLLGLGLLIRSSEAWFNAVKCAGAAYMGWLGVQSLRAKPRTDAAAADPGSADVLVRPSECEGGRAPHSHAGAFTVGFLTNALNPKATLFFISLFVLVVNPETPKLVQAGYGLWMAMATGGWFCLVTMVFTQPEVRAGFLRHRHWIDRALGVVLIGFAIRLAMTTVH